MAAMSDADLIAQQNNLQMQQAYAQALMQQSAEGQPQGQMRGDIYVAPSWTQQLSQALKGPMAAYMQKGLMDKQAAMYANLMGGDGQAAPATPGANSTALAAGAGGANPYPNTLTAANGEQVPPSMLPPSAGNTTGPTNANAMLASQLQTQGMPAQDTPAPAAPANPFSWRNMMRARLITQMGGEPMGAAFADQFKGSDTAKLLRESGTDPNSPTGQAAYRDKLTPPIIARGNPVLTYGADGKLQVDPASLSAITQGEEIKGRFGAPISLNTPSGSSVQLSPTEFSNLQTSGNLPQRLLPQDQRDKIQSDVNASGQPGKVQIGGLSAGSINPQNGPIGVSPSTFQTGLDKADADRVSAETTEINNTGITALSKVAQNNKMLELLPQITTGPLNKQITMVKNIGQSLGINLGDPAPNQEFDKYAIQGALSAAKQIYGSRITNQDVTTQIMSNPGATMAEKAIYQLLKYDNQMQQNHIQKMTARQDYQKNGGDLRNYNVWFAQNYPLMGNTAPAPGQSQGYQVPQPQGAAPAAGPTSIPDYANLYGIKPR